jgi:hypothetical protein
MTASTKYPPRGRDLFRKYNMVKLVRSAEAAGIEVGGIEVSPDGTLRILGKTMAPAATNPWDDVRAQDTKRSA